MERICNVCKQPKSLDNFYNKKSDKYGKGHTCKPCALEFNRAKFIYECPSCKTHLELQREAYRRASKLQGKCNSCAVKEWTQNKYGEKKERTFTSTCPRCSKTKHHKYKNISNSQLEYLSEKMNNHLCKSCSNSIYYVLSPLKINTKPEVEFKEILEEYNINYVQNFKYKGFHFDFYIPDMDILVEIDGNYWHGKGLNEDELNPTQLNSRKNDLRKNKICLDTKKTLIRLWEDEINENTVKTKLKL